MKEKKRYEIIIYVLFIFHIINILYINTQLKIKYLLK